MDKSRRIFFKTEELVKVTKLGWMETDLDFKMLYHNAWEWTSQLSGVCSRDFLLWVIARLDDDNKFVYSRSMYLEFLEDIRKIGTKEYEENTVHLALREFLDKGVARKISRAVYQIMPGIFYPEQMQREMKGARTVKQLRQQQETEMMKYPVLPEAAKENQVEQRINGKEPLEEDNFSGSLFSFDSFVE